MISAALPLNEKERVRALYEHELLDTAYEKDFDEIVQLASRICRVPISLISLIDIDRQWFKARVGLDAEQTGRNVSFCAHAIHQDEVFEVQDALEDKRFHDNPLVTGDPSIRYYAGVPLVTNSGYKIGTLCVIDRVPRNLDPEQAYTMKVLASQVMKLVDMRMLNKQLDRMTQVQNRSMSIMAHDIRNPLASITSMYELKNDGLLDEHEIKEMDLMIPDQVQATLHLLNNVVEWGHLQLSGSNDNDHVADVQEVINNCFAIVATQAKEKGNQLLQNIKGDLKVACKQASLEFIVRNLLTNACKFTSKGTVTVNAFADDHKIIVEMKDTGTGMSDDQLLSIRNKQYTASVPGTQKEKGNGLGLLLIRESLEAMKADMRIDSEKGNGSTFTLILPAAPNFLN